MAKVVRTRVPPALLEARLDAGYYRPADLAIEARVRALKGALVFGNTLSFFETGDGAKKPGHNRLLKTRAIVHDALDYSDFEETVEVSSDLVLTDGDALLTTYGVAMGKVACVVAPPASTTVDYTIAIIRSDASRADAFFLASYLRTSAGQALIQRRAKGSSMPFVLRSDLEDMPVPNVGLSAQRYIGGKVRQAERLRERARTLSRAGCELVDALIEQRTSGSELVGAQHRHESATAFVHRVNGRRPRPESNAGSARRFSRVTAITMTPDRMDSSYYAPRFLENERFLASCGTEMVPIATLADKCNCGSTPVDVEYDGRGPGLIRTTDVRPNSFLGHQVLRTSELRIGRDSSVAAVSEDLVYTMSGTIGYAAVIPQTDEVFSFSNTIVRARFSERSGQDPWFTAAFFNSKYGYTQSLRLVSGGIQGHVMPNPFKKLLVPAPDSRAQRYIGDQFRYADACANQARTLVGAAKLLVEQLIDGRVTEADLVAAQKALEAGDRSADREILKALRQSDAPDAKPLIADVEALYALLDEAEDAP